ncbi:MAG: 50S ribosomal protein L6 [Candidatus Woesearchaeota archaeon]
MEEKNKKEGLSESIIIPEGVETRFENSTIHIKGKNGDNSRDFSNPTIKKEIKDGKIVFSSEKASKREKKIIGTYKSHVKNMLRGIQELHIYKLKICSGHFPMNIKVSKEEVVINNFLGEKVPRKMKINNKVNVKMEGDVITVDSNDKEAAGQTAAKIEILTKVKGRDLRIFQDGIYITEKDGKLIR